MITGLVLAAGAGSRLGRPKADLVVAGRRLIDRAVTVLSAGGCDRVLAVVRDPAVQVPGAELVVNPSPEQGMGSSLRCGLAALDEAADACVITLVDLPDLTAGEVAAVIEAYRAGHPLVATRRAGHRSHPVLVARAWFGELGAAAEGDQAGRNFFRARQDQTWFVDYPDPISDIDTEPDLQEAERRLG